MNDYLCLAIKVVKMGYIAFRLPYHDSGNDFVRDSGRNSGLLSDRRPPSLATGFLLHFQPPITLFITLFQGYYPFSFSMQPPGRDQDIPPSPTFGDHGGLAAPYPC